MLARPEVEETLAEPGTEQNLFEPKSFDGAMARIRTIHPEIAQSRSMRRVSRDARLLFKLLLTAADDEGRARARIGLLAMQLFPDDADAPIMLPAWLGELEREGCIKCYTVEDDEFLVIVNWRRHQHIDHPTRSRLPAPPNFAKDSRDSREESGKSLDGNDNEAISRRIREPMKIPRTADGKIDPSADWLTEVVTEILVESKLEGSKDIALRSAHMLGRKLGMWKDGRSGNRPQEPADTGQNDLEEARAAQKLVGETSDK